jgi:hypothetical protein
MELPMPAGQVRMPRAPRLHAPVGTAYVVARRNNREFYLTAGPGFEVLLAHLRDMTLARDATLCAYALMANR